MGSRGVSRQGVSQHLHSLNDRSIVRGNLSARGGFSADRICQNIMSSESEMDLELHFLPAWAKQSPEVNRYAKYEGGEERPARGRDDRGRSGGPRDRAPRRDGPGGDRRPTGGRSGPPRRDRGYDPRAEAPRRSEPPAVLPEVQITLLPEEKGVEALARQIKLTGRAYPLFDIAHLVLNKPERYHVVFGVVKKAGGQIAQPLFVCNLDESLWLSEAEAVSHVLSRHFATFYQAERTATEPPKGTYTFVAQCGMSGIILGPPNYHDYQKKLHQLHAERFARLPFEAFKARVKIVKDEIVVKKWLDDQSFKTEYVCLNLPETIRLASREEVEKHFRETHVSNIIKPVEKHTLNGAVAQRLPAPVLRQLVHRAWEDQMRFPLAVVNVLSQQFASHGLQFFKVNKTVTHAAVARPHFLDVNVTPVSTGIKRIIEFINATPRCNRRKILTALAPVSAPSPTAVAPEVTAAPGVAAPAVASEAAAPTPEQSAVIGDLHWLIHQGHVIEFASGLVETAKAPLPRPVKPVKPAVEKSKAPADGAAAGVPPSSESPPAPAVPVEPTVSNSPEPATEAVPASVVPEPSAGELSAGA